MVTSYNANSFLCCVKSLRYRTYLLAMIVSLPSSIYAQRSGGEVRGTITDSSGAAITDAEITIEGVATQETRRLLSNATGLYDAPNLAVGIYNLTVKAPGFSSGERTGINVQVGTDTEVDVQLRIGGSSETITIASESATVDLLTSQSGAVDDGRIVRQLPLNGRDWTTLAACSRRFPSFGPRMLPR